MPSRNQTGTSTGDYPDEPTKMLATKNDLTIAALIRGIRKPERAQAYIEAEVALADREDRDPRKGIIGACNRKKNALEDDSDTDTPVDIDTTEDTPDDEDADTGERGADTGDHDSDHGSDGDDEDEDPYPGVPRFDSVDALEDVVADHDHDDTFTTAKPAGTVAGCFKCESNIGFVPRDRDADTADVPEA